MTKTGLSRERQLADAGAQIKAARQSDAREIDHAIEALGVPYDLIELFFFAYRDFVGGPDRVLAAIGFGRAHHRVLHFVNRNPGLTIAELLDILKITKQSLNRVLKELVEKGYVQTRTGRQDRRQRHLETTPAGKDLARQLAEIQGRQVREAVAAIPSGARGAVEAYLTAMIEDEERRKVLARIRKGPVG
jgi:DNA-binding MarR family transcriptional regulator